MSWFISVVVFPSAEKKTKTEEVEEEEEEEGASLQEEDGEEAVKEGASDAEEEEEDQPQLPSGLTGIEIVDICCKNRNSTTSQIQLRCLYVLPAQCLHHGTGVS